MSTAANQSSPPPISNDEPAAKPSTVIIGAVCMLWLIQLYGQIFFGTSQYFSFTDLSIASVHEIHLTGAIVRLLLPVVVGFGIALLSKGSPLKESTLAGLIAPFLLCWPGIYFPKLREDLVGESLADQPGKLLAIYGFFILSYSLLARFGAIAGIYYGRLRMQDEARALWQKVHIKDLIWTIIIGLITNVIWEIVLKLAH
jgi:hypothetical protein